VDVAFRVCLVHIPFRVRLFMHIYIYIDVIYSIANLININICKIYIYLVFGGAPPCTPCAVCARTCTHVCWCWCRRIFAYIYTAYTAAKHARTRKGPRGARPQAANPVPVPASHKHKVTQAWRGGGWAESLNLNSNSESQQHPPSFSLPAWFPQQNGGGLGVLSGLTGAWYYWCVCM